MKRLLALLCACVLLIVCLPGCTNAPAVTMHDTGTTNEIHYSNNDFWKEPNTIRLVTDVTIQTEQTEEDQIYNNQYSNLPKKNEKTIAILKEGIISFFQERYNLDVSEKLASQQVRIFSSSGISEGVMGYVEIGNKEILNLNERLLQDFSYAFETTYVHETLHQLGFQDEKPYLIMEGITDALTDMILCYLGIEPALTAYYSESRTVGYQLLAADPEIVSCYLGEDDFDILERINEKLQNVHQPFRKSGHLGKLLEKRLQILYAIATGTIWGLSTDPYWIAFEVQEVVQAYCQECDPDVDTINYIRSHYLVTDYEQIVIVEDGEGYRGYTE